MLNAILCGTSSDKLEAIFRICDVNGNGFIEKQELIHIIQVSIIYLVIYVMLNYFKKLKVFFSS